MRRGAAAAFTAFATSALALARPAHAVEREHRIGVGVGPSLLVASGQTNLGVGVDAHYVYGISDAFNLMVEGSWANVTFRGESDAPRTRPNWLATGDVGASYVFDVLRWVPYVGVLVGGTTLSGGPLGRTKILPDLEIAAGLDYRIDRSWSVGVEAREHMQFTEMSTYPSIRPDLRARRVRLGLVSARRRRSPARSPERARELRLGEPEAVVQRAHRELGVLRRDEAADLDLARRDRLDVDALVREDAEHLRRDAGVRAHAEADDRHLHDVLVVAHLARAEALRDLLDPRLRAGEVGLGEREGDGARAGRRRWSRSGRSCRPRCSSRRCARRAPPRRRACRRRRRRARAPRPCRRRRR